MTIERQTFSIPEYAKIFGISKNGGYLSAKRGDIKTIKIGGKILVPRSEIDRLLNPRGTETEQVVGADLVEAAR